MDELATLAQRIIAAPHATLGELVGDGPVQADATAPPTQWEGKATIYPKVDIGTLFDQVALQHADRTALVLGDQQLTTATLQQRVTRDQQRGLDRRGVRPGQPVGLCAWTGAST
jgi:non-ribosomal peptide synthetase component F